MLRDLQNNVMSAVLLVMIVVVAALGVRSGLLVGVAIPGSFLAGILVLAAAGFTVNIVVLFSLILAVGMLVDGAIVVTEYADRRMNEGAEKRTAYAEAAKRMAWPIIASTATTLAAFAPLLFWPGIVGEFMKFLPITLIATLSASLIMALIFVPTLGAKFGRASVAVAGGSSRAAIGETGDINRIGGFTGLYLRALRVLLRHPAKVLVVAFVTLFGAWGLYLNFGKGVEFFPKVEPENAVLQIFGRGNLSVEEKDGLVREVEQRVLAIQRERGEFRAIYTLAGVQERRDDSPEDIIGQINLEFGDWDTRRKRGRDPGRHLRAGEGARRHSCRKRERKRRTADRQADPPAGDVALSELIQPTVGKIRAHLDGMTGLKDIEDGRPVPGIEWELKVDRAQASKFAADVSLIGNMIRLVTNGLKLSEYRPDDSDDEIDIVARYPSTRGPSTSSTRSGSRPRRGWCRSAPS